MNQDIEYDLAIVGSGSAAFAAAIRARSYGASVVMIERDTIGGTCVNVGCVPSKFLLHAGERWQNGSADLSGVIDQKDDLVGFLRDAKYEQLVERYGFHWRQGTGRFADPQTLLVDDQPIRAAKFLIATGSTPKIPPIAGLVDAGYLTSTSALDLRHVPKTLAVIGGNAVGLELGQYFASVGSRVVVFEALSRIAPLEESELSDALSRALAAEGIQIRTGVAVQSVSSDGTEKRLRFKQADGTEDEIAADEILVATGRAPNTAHLALNAANVRTTAQGAVAVDDELRSSNPAIYAAGDVTGAPQFVYVAGYQGALAAENAIAGSRRRSDLSALPRVIFTSPQLAAVGMTETEALREGLEVKTATLPVGSAVPRAIVNGRDGVVKIIADRSSDRILGVHMAAENAAEVIQAATLAVKFNLTVADLLDTFHPYLTMAESLKLAAQSFERDVASLSCCAS